MDSKSKISSTEFNKEEAYKKRLEEQAANLKRILEVIASKKYNNLVAHKVTFFNCNFDPTIDY
jgi:hypothetical protein